MIMMMYLLGQIYPILIFLIFKYIQFGLSLYTVPHIITYWIIHPITSNIYYSYAEDRREKR